MKFRVRTINDKDPREFNVSIVEDGVDLNTNGENPIQLYSIEIETLEELLEFCEESVDEEVVICTSYFKDDDLWMLECYDEFTEKDNE